ncbi:hypothetical protein HIM_07880 [Hirsutella minnesotensis 3608]|uniref:Uncharacterized protein n=1 Tax=Hirsutella minnesotensis 3608 TaxID=1043627 RepID=A0A0F7ZT88_9HYPO|nr:hypothetical protein HIM_07880 [Hirsutella minnesotensis 3608]
MNLIVGPASPTASSQELPMELLHLICDYLVDCDTSRRSLRSFSQVNKACAEATRKQFFQHMKLFVESPSQIKAEAKLWNRFLVSPGHAVHVRQLTITGCLRDHYTGRDWPALPNGPVRDTGANTESWNDVANRSFAISPCHCRGGHMEKIVKKNKAWKPLADLLKKLPALRDLLFDADYYFPPCLLSALHHHQPQTRLHINNFAFSLLDYSSREACKIHRSVLDLFSSPCLYSFSCIVFRTSASNHQYIPWRQAEAVLRTLVHHAPGLRNLAFSPGYPPCYSDTPTEAWIPSPSWLGLNPSQKPLGLACLRSLRFGSATTAAVVETWSHHVDFSKVEALEIHYEAKDQTYSATLTDMVHRGLLRSLRALTVYGRLELDNRTKYVSDVGPLLRIMHPLESFSLDGLIKTDIVEALAQHHGMALRYLSLLWMGGPLSNNKFKMLQEHCPQLTDLKIGMQRTQGDEQEVEVYQILGGMPRLERLELLLDIEVPQPFREEDSCCANISEHITKGFVNAAIDATLARSIFRIISAAQCRGSQRNSAVLQELTLCPGRQPVSYATCRRCDQCREHPGWTADHVSLWLARGFVCEKNGWGIEDDDVSVRQTSCEDEESAEKILEEMVDGKQVDPPWDSDMDLAPDIATMTAWEQLWGKIEGPPKEWMHNWASLPLKEDMSDG